MHPERLRSASPYESHVWKACRHSSGKRDLWQIPPSIAVTGFPRKVLAEPIRVAKGQRVKTELLKGAQMESSCVKLRCLQDAFAVAYFSASEGFSVLAV